MDVKSAFLHGDLTEEIYMEQPPSFEKDGSLVCQLKQSLYGLKQAPKAWHEKINKLFLNFGFKRCESEHNVYVLHVNNDNLIITLYVDDLVITRGSVDLISGFEETVNKYI
jgi:hypothetical protein